MAISFTPTKIARFVGALYGVALSNNVYNAAMAEIQRFGFSSVANDVFAADFGTKTTGSVASTIAANLGLTGQASTDAVAYITGQLNGAAPADRGAVISNILNLFAGLTTDPVFGAAATAFESRVESATLYSLKAENVQHGAFGSLVSANVFELTTGFDKLTGTSGDDVFQAFSVNNVNTLQDGDVLNGGAGNDKLFADIVSRTLGSDAITPRTNSIEQAIFRVQHGQTDSGDNNIAGKGIIDAERMVGTNIYEDNNSRADLVVEDVRIQANQITKDITVVMRDTDPGNVDFGLYFDQNSLRNVSSSTSTINLRVLDTYAVSQGLPELKDSPYGSFTFYFSSDNGTTWTKTELASQAMQDAQTITDMITALQAQVDAKFGAGAVTVSKGVAYTVTDSVTSATVASNEIKLSTNANIQFDTTKTGSGWKATDTVPAVSGLYTNFNTSASSSTALVTSTIILDNVGRGSNGGELLVGGLSVGTTSLSKGVQQFDITVQDTSKLSRLSSTNNALQVVNIVNGTTDVQSDAYVTRVKDAGNLNVGRNLGLGDAGASDLPGTTSASTFGFTDVQTINAAAMTGKLSFSAEITKNSIAKYLALGDTGANPASDNVAFVYTGGTNDDRMDVTIDSATAASQTVSGQPDFTFALNGGNGNDVINLSMGGNRTGAWVVDQRQLQNISIDGGNGNDTITTHAGSVRINAGTGNDTVYVDRDGTVGAKWVVNDSTPAILGDLESNTPVVGFMYKGKLTVTFSGAGGTGLGGGVTNGAAAANTNGFEVVVDVPTGSNYEVTQLHLNQAIKAAINNDAVLSKLLAATDGPSNTLVISSLIDAAFNANDLRMTVSSTDLTTLTAAEQTTALAAYKTWAHNSAAVIATAQTANAAAVTAFNGVAGMDTNQVLGANTGSGITINVAVTTQGVNEVFEIQTINVSALNVAVNDTIDFTIDGSKVTYKNTGNAALTGDALEADISTVLGGQNVGGTTYTFTNPSNGTGDLTITQSVAGKGKDIANITADWSGNGVGNDATGKETTKGVAAVAEVFTATVTGQAAAAEALTFDGKTTANLAAGDNGTVIAAALNANANGAVYSHTVSGNVVTYTAITKGVVADALAADFNSSVVTTTANGTISGNDSSNTINMGGGTSDVVVLGTGANSHDTLVFTGYDQGRVTVMNFEDTAAANRDLVDFRSYLTGKSSASGSVDSQVNIQVTLNADANVEANSVTVLGTAVFNTTTAKWSDLTAAKLLAAINSTNTGAADFAGITKTTLDAVNTYTGSGAGTTLVGGTGHAVVLVENNLNRGEYAMFDLTFNGLAANATADFSDAKLIGIVDFGHQVGFNATGGANNLALFA